MQRFIPFDDQWDELARLDPALLVPYHVDVPCERGLAGDQRAVPVSPSIESSSPSRSPMRPEVPAATSRT
ncbi:hypothetical protein SAMN02800694_3533 [Luteibacter sp. UNCMF331Sha3.1]|nr:hypothetical protein SAMN02800694_3533 [Luteibacter sp. UNCMF331Sha3.1]